MENALALINMLAVDGPKYLSALIAVLTALIGFFMLIPGEQPEKALQKVVDFIGKFSKK